MEKKKRVAALWFVALTIGMLTVISVLNLRLLFEPAQSLGKGEISAAEFIDKVQEAYPDKFFGKTKLININGLYGRVMGRRVYNGAVLLKNGMLSKTQERLDMEESEAALKVFQSCLEKRGIPFLFVLAPAKADLAGELFPHGVTTNQNANADELLSLLEKDQVNTLDLRPMLSATSEEIEAYFYRTDHHWTPTGALSAVEPITKEMGRVLNKNLDLTYADPELWEKHTVKDWFLGSHGKRVGTLFGGVDDLIYYTPKFETEMSCAIPKHRTLYKGDFSQANIRDEHIIKKDYFGDNPYCVYIGGDYPLVQHRNQIAPNDLKVMLIKDSFMLPEQAFQSALFSEIDVVDPRHFSQCTITEYVDIYQPDIVVMIANPSMEYQGFYKKLDSGNIVERGKARWNIREVIEACSIEIRPGDNPYNYETIATNSMLERGKRYTISFESVDFTQGYSDGVVLSLYDRTMNRVITSGIFDITFCKEHSGFNWTFDMPTDNNHDLQVIAYPGMPGATNGNGAIYHGVKMQVIEQVGWR